MKVNIQSIHFDADAKLLEFIQKKLDKLETFYDRIVDADVYLKVEKKETFKNKLVEIKLNVPGEQIFSSQTHDSFEGGTDEAVEALKIQIKRFKEKQVTTHTL
jgi:putative sigma-54 modulation protein